MWAGGACARPLDHVALPGQGLSAFRGAHASAWLGDFPHQLLRRSVYPHEERPSR